MPLSSITLDYVNSSRYSPKHLYFTVHLYSRVTNHPKATFEISFLQKMVRAQQSVFLSKILGSYSKPRKPSVTAFFLFLGINKKSQVPFLPVYFFLEHTRLGSSYINYRSLSTFLSYYIVLYKTKHNLVKDSDCLYN